MAQTPLHVAIIPDGNRRWAKQHGISGYSKLYDLAIQNLIDIAERAFDLGVTHLTLWGSSHANLSARSSSFLKGLEKAFRDNIHRFAEHPIIETYDIHISIIGEWRNSLSQSTVRAFEEVMHKTAHRKTRELTLLIDYSGNRERTAALQSILAHPTSNMPVEQRLRAHSWTGHLPDVDLVIRTGSWQDPHNSAGFLSLLVDEAQLSFPAVFWPDFTPEQLNKVFDDFHSRQRRLGK